MDVFFHAKKNSRVAELVSPGDYKTSLTTKYNVYHGQSNSWKKKMKDLF